MDDRNDRLSRAAIGSQVSRVGTAKGGASPNPTPSRRVSESAGGTDVSMSEIFRLVQSLMGDRGDAWLDRHCEALGAVPAQLAITPGGRKQVHVYLMELKEQASKMARGPNR